MLMYALSIFINPDRTQLERQEYKQRRSKRQTSRHPQITNPAVIHNFNNNNNNNNKIFIHKTIIVNWR